MMMIVGCYETTNQRAGYRCLPEDNLKSALRNELLSPILLALILNDRSSFCSSRKYLTGQLRISNQLYVP